MAPHWKGEAVSLFPARAAEGPALGLREVTGGQACRDVLHVLATSFLPRTVLGHFREVAFLAGA